jgi:peptidoglycan/xylan/chitin deacetylase (PgdA/CDA1 family)
VSGATARVALVLIGAAIGCTRSRGHEGAEQATWTSTTRIARWQDDKAGAVSLTYDDGSANQFRVALPLMQRRRLPATFFVVTGDIEGSSRTARYLGRPISDIVRESSSRVTSQDNFFERATAIRYAPYAGAREAHKQIGEAYEAGNAREAYAIVDRTLADIRSGRMKPASPPAASGEAGDGPPLRWADLQQVATQGYEFASHSVSHPYLSVLDDPNLVRELEESRDEIRDRLGPRHTFSFECPFGIEDDRAVRLALARYPFVRNRMADPNVDDLDRDNPRDPAASTAETVRWQRGPLRATPFPLMVQWVETTARRDNIWLVLVFHGVEGIGWEPLPASELDAYFDVIDRSRDRLWIATYQDVGKYVRERAHARVDTTARPDRIVVTLTHDLDPALYDLPLSLQTDVPGTWSSVRVEQGGAATVVPSTHAPAVAPSTHAARNDSPLRVLYSARPNGPPIVLQSASGQP